MYRKKQRKQGAVRELSPFFRREAQKRQSMDTPWKAGSVGRDAREDNSRHKLSDIIAIVICASICGANGWTEMEDFGKAKRRWIERFLELPHGIPSHDTFGEVFARIDPQVLNERFRSWCEQLGSPGEGEDRISSLFRQGDRVRMQASGPGS